MATAKGPDTDLFASIQKQVRALYEDGASVDAIEAKMIHLFSQSDIEAYLESGVRTVVVDEIEALRKGRARRGPKSSG